MKRRPRVYISGPISKGDMHRNICQADDAMLQLVKAGYSPFNPMLSVYAGGASPYKPLGNGERLVFAPACAGASGGFRDITHAEWIDMDLAWVEVSDAVLRLPGYSVGADRECDYAAQMGIPVFNTLDSLTKHFESRKAGF